MKQNGNATMKNDSKQPRRYMDLLHQVTRLLLEVEINQRYMTNTYNMKMPLGLHETAEDVRNALKEYLDEKN